MSTPDEELPLEVKIEAAEERLRIHEGFARALREPAVVLNVLLEAEDADAGLVALKRQLGVDDLQAKAILDMQFRRVTRQERARVEERRQEAQLDLQFLRNS